MLSRPMLRSRVVLNAHVWGRSWRAYVAQVKSALPRGADIAKAECQVRLVPIPEVPSLSFDHLVGLGEQRGRHGEAKGFSGL
jgi:hypothetical protein